MEGRVKPIEPSAQPFCEFGGLEVVAFHAGYLLVGVQPRLEGEHLERHTAACSKQHDRDAVSVQISRPGGDVR